MFNFKKKEQRVEPVQQETITNNDLKHEAHDLRIHALLRKVAEQEIIIRRLLELVTMNIEHKDYSKFLLPKITAIRNLLDKN